jgi:hypothetical protein
MRSDAPVSKTRLRAKLRMKTLPRYRYTAL